jgi:Fe-S-cluster-containing hydrogenase component 2
MYVCMYVCTYVYIQRNTQNNGAVSKVNKKCMSYITRAQHTPSAAATVQVSHALPAVRFSCLLRGRGASFKDGVAAGEGFLCAPF